ncbi:phage minor head protein, partial [uncultured Meiothermus sp.]|uniref:phage head morphogenesis protein n=1 Tax=uncultured Meiothermus sp. TaxID=157471 RepID=UPI00262DD298
LDMVQEVVDALDAGLAEGETFEQFQSRLSLRVQKAWGGQSPHRLKTIFDTNIQMAYGAGRYKAADELRAERPYWGLAVVLDGRTSRICLNLAGVVRPADDTFWHTHTPPLHFRCRTALVTFSAEQAEGRVTRMVPFQPPMEGFGSPPGRRAWSPDPADYHPELWAAYNRLRADDSPAVEHERARPGVHYQRAVTHLSATDRETVLRALDKAKVLGFLERRSLGDIRILERLTDPLDGGLVGGDYDPRTRSIRISAERPRLKRTFRSGDWGAVERVSDVAPNPVQSMQKSLAHELTHDLIWAWAEALGSFPAVEQVVRPVFNRANPVSARAGFSWREYLCETNVAYIYHQELLRRHDPAGRAIIGQMRERLGIPL